MELRFKHLPTPFKHNDEWWDNYNGWNSYETWKAAIQMFSNNEWEREAQWVKANFRKDRAQVLANRLKFLLGNDKRNIDWLQLSKWCLKNKEKSFKIDVTKIDTTD